MHVANLCVCIEHKFFSHILRKRNIHDNVSQILRESRKF